MRQPASPSLELPYLLIGPFFKRFHPLDLLLGQATWISSRHRSMAAARWPQLRPRAALRFTHTALRVSRKNFKPRQGATRAWRNASIFPEIFDYSLIVRTALEVEIGRAHV